MSILTLSDNTTRRNKQKIIKETTNSYTGITMSGTFKINAYSSWSYNTGYYNSTNQGIGLYDKFVFNRVASYNNDMADGYIVITMIPNDDSSKRSYAQLQYAAASNVTSCYLNGDVLTFNYSGYKWQFDIINNTRSNTAGNSTAGTNISNSQVSFLGYNVISDAYVDGSYNNSSGFNVSPLIKFNG